MFAFSWTLFTTITEQFFSSRCLRSHSDRFQLHFARRSIRCKRTISRTQREKLGKRSSTRYLLMSWLMSCWARSEWSSREKFLPRKWAARKATKWSETQLNWNSSEGLEAKFGLSNCKTILIGWNRKLERRLEVLVENEKSDGKLERKFVVKIIEK